MKNISFLSENFQVFLEVKFSIYLNRRVFVMCPLTESLDTTECINRAKAQMILRNCAR